MPDARVLFAPPTEDDRFLPEGPKSVTVDGRPALAWVNIQTGPEAKTGAVHLRFWDTDEHRVVRLAGRPGFLALTDRPDVVLVGRDKELGTLNLATGNYVPLATIADDDPRTMINDGASVPGGHAVVFGTKDVLFREPIADLYLYTVTDNQITKLADRQTCSNGKVFARDARGLILYDIDTPRRVVTLNWLDLDRRHLTDGGVAVDLRNVDGFPDGMADCGDGTAVIAMYDPGPAADGRAYHYDLRTGERLGDWLVPGSPRVTCPLLVERDGRVELVLTTAVEGMPDARRGECPNAGDLFIAQTGFGRAPPSVRVKLG
jgi:sugar lactone lactonase YvrE